MHVILPSIFYAASKKKEKNPHRIALSRWDILKWKDLAGMNYLIYKSCNLDFYFSSV